MREILVGAVAYDAKCVPIWEAMREYFREFGPAIDFVLYSNYDRLVQSLLSRHVHIAWNTNLAWVKTYRLTNGTCKALAMRDVDACFYTVIGSRTESPVRSPADLKGKTLALGSADSVQAAILPIYWLQQANVEPERDCKLLRFNVDVGKHGDTGTSETNAIQALLSGQAQAVAVAEVTWQKWVSEGKIDTEKFVALWRSPAYCHCVFTALADFPDNLGKVWVESLLAMKYSNPRWRPLMEMEGVKEWLPVTPERLQGYKSLFEAVEQQKISLKVSET